MEALMTTVRLWAMRCKMDEGQITTAISLAWLYRSRYLEGGGQDDFPDGHWARLAVRAVRHGRDLPGCGTGQADALMHAHQGCGMGEMMDRSPPPDVMADHKERYEMVMADLNEAKRVVAAMRIEGWSNFEIAQALKVSPGRSSQIARQIVEAFLECE